MNRRIERLNSQFHQDVSEVIQRGLRDKKIQAVKKFITVTKVELSPDLDLAKIYISVIGDEEFKKKVLHLLVQAKGPIKAGVSEKLTHLRDFPDFRFYLDDDIESLIHMDQLLAKIAPKPQPKPESESQE